MSALSVLSFLMHISFGKELRPIRPPAFHICSIGLLGLTKLSFVLWSYSSLSHKTASSCRKYGLVVTSLSSCATLLLNDKLNTISSAVPARRFLEYNKGRCFR
ncbi:hypothetical protein BD410DRAFT_560506 [Rickenella mellea]|uniref:Uncharacterized protein n=1 Tax=Rickenella mellea TaxID=50990 RepID=A0A4Y7QFL5_9AGAM|nr:hypothetical protein BD410DRAFT_560506 [Rickenella mellea]